jgi:manganese/iron transport system ATP-binding protein
MRDPALSVRNATVTYRNGHTALARCDFKIPAGTITALVGVNGSGNPPCSRRSWFIGLAGGRDHDSGQPVNAALKERCRSMPQSEDID